jgi:hypothetical protein
MDQALELLNLFGDPQIYSDKDYQGNALLKLTNMLPVMPVTRRTPKLGLLWIAKRKS